MRPMVCSRKFLFVSVVACSFVSCVVSTQGASPGAAALAGVPVSARSVGHTDGHEAPPSPSRNSLGGSDSGDTSDDGSLPTSSGTLGPLPVLRDGYSPCTFAADTTARPSIWLDVFERDTTSFATRAATIDPQAAQRFADAFRRIVAELRLQGEACNVLTLCRLREECLRAAGFDDLFTRVKSDENAAALALLPSVLRHIDKIKTSPGRMKRALTGVFAGNIFDLGAAASIARFERGSGSGSFTATVAELEGAGKKRLAIDNLDAFLACACPSLSGDAESSNGSSNGSSHGSSNGSSHGSSSSRLFGSSAGTEGYKRVVIFVDNAGADVVLGILPFARELLRAHLGVTLALAANEKPAINDVTATELQALLESIASVDHDLGQFVASGQLYALSSGGDLPAIDLRRVSEEVQAAAASADLVVLEGMGRGIETNLEASMTVDCLNLGMIKHVEVAQLLGGQLYDCVCRFKPKVPTSGW